MSVDVGAHAKGMTYPQARRLIVAAGSVVLGLVAVVMYVRRVETVEVVAVLLFLPVFLALLRWNEIGGLVAGVAAAVTYVALRWPAIHAVGLSHFTGLIASRVIGLIVFGLIGGWANSQLRSSLTKLDLYDQIDDATGLFNARFFLLDTDLEAARAARYRTFFSVSVVDVPVEWFAPLGRRQAQRVVRDLGRMLRESVRTVDRAVHYEDRDRHRLAVILPETGAEGVGVFTRRLAASLAEWLAARGVSGAGDLATVTVTFPEDDGSLHRLRAEFAEIEHYEHPLTPEVTP